jgi:hypothetical protein
MPDVDIMASMMAAVDDESEELVRSELYRLEQNEKRKQPQQKQQNQQQHEPRQYQSLQPLRQPHGNDHDGDLDVDVDSNGPPDRQSSRAASVISADFWDDVAKLEAQNAKDDDEALHEDLFQEVDSLGLSAAAVAAHSSAARAAAPSSSSSSTANRPGAVSSSAAVKKGEAPILTPLDAALAARSDGDKTKSQPRRSVRAFSLHKFCRRWQHAVAK